MYRLVIEMQKKCDYLLIGVFTPPIMKVVESVTY